jgi:hypothetical protein
MSINLLLVNFASSMACAFTEGFLVLYVLVTFTCLLTISARR